MTITLLMRRYFYFWFFMWVLYVLGFPILLTTCSARALLWVCTHARARVVLHLRDVISSRACVNHIIYMNVLISPCKNKSFCSNRFSNNQIVYISYIIFHTHTHIKTYTHTHTHTHTRTHPMAYFFSNIERTWFITATFHFILYVSFRQYILHFRQRLLRRLSSLCWALCHPGRLRCGVHHRSASEGRMGDGPRGDRIRVSADAQRCGCFGIDILTSHDTLWPLRRRGHSYFCVWHHSFLRDITVFLCDIIGCLVWYHILSVIFLILH